MKRFMVFEPPAAPGDNGPRPSGGGATERAVFVRDGFSIWAFLLPWVWLLRHGLFLAALVVFAVCGGLGYLAETGRGLLAVPLLVLLGLLVALEGPPLRARRLLRRGWRDMGAVNAANMGEATILYFAANAARRRPAGRADANLPWGFAPVAAENAPRRRWWRRFGRRRAAA